MTNVRIVDASALGAVVFSEPAADTVNARLRVATLAAPTLLAYELANVCLTKIRRHRDRRDALLDQFAAFQQIPIEFFEIDFADTLSLAEAYHLSLYDAAYLWLAQRLGSELVTLDRQLQDAWLAGRQSG